MWVVNSVSDMLFGKNPLIAAENNFLKNYALNPEKLEADSKGRLIPYGEVDKKVMTALKSSLLANGEIDFSKFESEISQLDIFPKLKEKAIQIAETNLTKATQAVALNQAPLNSANNANNTALTERVTAFNNKSYTKNQETAFNAFIKKFASLRASLENLEGDFNTRMGNAFLNRLDDDGKLDLDIFLKTAPGEKEKAQKICEDLVQQGVLVLQNKAMKPSVSDTPSHTSTQTITVANLGFDNCTADQIEAFNKYMPEILFDSDASTQNIPSGAAAQKIARAFLASLNEIGRLDTQKFENLVSKKGLDREQREKFDEMMNVYEFYSNRGSF